MPRLKLISSDNKILREKNAGVAFPLSKEVRELIDQMFFAVRKFRGVGLAASQVGKNLRLAVIDLNTLEIPPFAIINPVIKSKSFRKASMEEGCLSIPGKYAEVKRPETIKLEFFTQGGKKVKLKAEGFLARVFQHEIDHLNGIIISDKWDVKTLRDIPPEGS